MSDGWVDRITDRLPEPVSRLWQKGADWRALIYVAAIAVAFLMLTLLLHLPHGPQHWSGDLQTRFLSPRPATQDNRIVLVYVSEKTLADKPYLSPVDRGVLAALVERIASAEPKAIGLDFVLDRKTEPGKDATLARVLHDLEVPTVLGAIDERTPGGDVDFQETYLAATGKPVGHLYFDEHHGTFTVSEHVIRYLGKPGPSHPDRKSFTELLAEAAHVHPGHDGHYIAWRQPPADGTEAFPTLPAELIIGPNGAAMPLAALFKDRIVLIGGSFADRDRHLTPMSVLHDTRYPGLAIHAQILAQYLDGRSLDEFGWPMRLLFLLVAAAFGFHIGRTGPPNHMLIELAVVVSLLVLGSLLFVFASRIFPYTGVLLTWLCGVTVGHASRGGHEPASSKEAH